MPTTTIRYFSFGHLPAQLQTVSAPIGKLAEKLEALLPDGPEKSTGMRKLLEAKDCFVRSALDTPHPKMMPWQMRLVEERDDLADKMKALTAFLEAPRLYEHVNEDENLRLGRQAEAMALYLSVLNERISAFTA